MVITNIFDICLSILIIFGLNTYEAAKIIIFIYYNIGSIGIVIYLIYKIEKLYYIDIIPSIQIICYVIRLYIISKISSRILLSETDILTIAVYLFFAITIYICTKNYRFGKMIECCANLIRVSMAIMTSMYVVLDYYNFDNINFNFNFVIVDADFIFIIYVLIIIIEVDKYNKPSINNPITCYNKIKKNKIISPQDKIMNKFISTYATPINAPYVIGISGGSGSGKTFIADLITNTIKEIFPNSESARVTVISQDSYYRGGNADTNYDVPDAIDFDLLITHLRQLINGYAIDKPIYDFATHSRTKETVKIYPSSIIVVEGILIFTLEELRNLFNIKLFVSADEATQIFRRIVRDINERGRKLNEVHERYVRDVWPSYTEHILPSSKYADMIIDNFDDCFVGPQIMLNHIISIIKNMDQ